MRSDERSRLTCLGVAAAALALAACGDEEIAEFRRDALADSSVAAYWGPDAAARPSDETVDRGRRDTSWWSAPSVDSVLRSDDRLSLPTDERVYRPPRDSYRIPETWTDLNELAMRDTLPIAAPETPRIPDPEASDERDVGSDPGKSATVIPLDAFTAMHLPLGGAVEGPSVLYAQVLLDGSRFSPGAIDGKWGSNTERSVFWFQRRHGIAPTGQIDSITLARLYDAAGRPPGLLARYRVTAADAGERYTPLPDDVYAQDTLDCLCYESIAERLAERAHATEALLAELNPGVDLGALAVGDAVVVPAAGDLAPRSGREVETSPRARPDPAAAPGRTGARTDADSASGAEIAELVVSDRGRYVHALDAEGALLYHFPATLGSRYHPSPRETLEVASITRDPGFHYQPSLLAGVSDTLPDTLLPPGPNSLVGVVWIRLSRAHFGIHGTNEPATIGHTHSSGCIRLTNWDASFLADRIRPGVTVRFVDLES